MGRAIDKLKALGPEGRARMSELYPRHLKCLVWEAVRERVCEGDFWFYLKRVVKNPVLYDPYHEPMARSMEDRYWTHQRRIELHPRGHIKSNILTITYGAWRIIRNPDIRILVGSHRQEDAEGFAGAIRSQLESPEVQFFFPEIKPAMSGSKEACWRDDAFRVARKSGLKEHTVETTSVAVSRTGHHYNLFIADDTVTDKNTKSATLMRKAIDWFKSCIPLLDPGAWVLLVGTRYNHSDLYGVMMREGADDWQVTIRKVVENGAPIYPTRFHMGAEHIGDPKHDEHAKFSIPKLKSQLGSWLFSSQYNNDPVDEENAAFKLADIRVIPSLPAGRNYVYLRVCDLSSEEKTKSKTAIADVAIDDLANIYITNIFRKQCDPSEIIKELKRAQKLPESIRPKKVGGEKAMLERVLKHFIDKATADDGVFIPWAWLPGDQAQKSKEQRVLGLQSWVEGGKFFILETCKDKEVLIDELTRFPHAGDMDVADACAQIPHIMWPAEAVEVGLSEEEKKDAQMREWMESQFGISLGFEEEEDSGFVIGKHSVGGAELGRALAGLAASSRRVA